MAVPGTQRVLIVSASIGDGHNRAAQAVQEALSRRGVYCHVVDFFAARHFGRLLKEAYFGTLRLAPEVYDYFYRYMNASAHGEHVKSLLAHASRRYLRQLVEAYRPDVLVFTHPFPCGAAAGLKRRGLIRQPVVAVVTDFAVHRFWQYPEVDHYCVAHETLAGQFSGIGGAVHATGIPIRAIFTHPVVTPPQLNSVLVMGGGLGLGPMVEIVQRLAAIPDANSIAVVCGRNHRLYRALRGRVRLDPDRVRVYGYTEQIPRLMAQAAVLVTKAGALTCSEALAQGVPLVLGAALPGQEEDNARFLSRRGAAVWTSSPAALAAAVAEIMRRPERRRDMVRAGRCLARPQAAAEVADLVQASLARRQAGMLTGGFTY